MPWVHKKQIISTCFYEIQETVSDIGFYFSLENYIRWILQMYISSDGWSVNIQGTWPLFRTIFPNIYTVVNYTEKPL